MASTQYIGARYVPIFYTDPDTGSNAWRSGIAYDPLTIVTDLNQSYTSKIPVPATVGRPSENPAYWVITGAYNAQVDQYRSEVDALSAEVDNKIEDLETEVDNKIEDLETEVDDKLENINVYTNKKFLIIGDSLSDTSLAISAPNWVTYFTQRVAALGGTVINNSASGRSLSNVRTNNIETALASVQDPASYTDIILFLGINDWEDNASLAQITAALNTFQTWHNTNNPGALIHMITPIRSARSFNPNNSLCFVRCAMINYGAKHYRWQIIDTYNEAPNFDGMNTELRDLWSVDGLHFKPAYAETFSDYIFNRLQSGTSNVITIGSESFTINSNVTDVPITLTCYDNGDIGFLCTFPNGYTPPSALLNLGTLPTYARPTHLVSNVFYYNSCGTKIGLLHIKTTGVVYVIFDNNTAILDAMPNFTYKSAAVSNTSE